MAKINKRKLWYPFYYFKILDIVIYCEEKQYNKDV